MIDLKNEPKILDIKVKRTFGGNTFGQIESYLDGEWDREFLDDLEKLEEDGYFYNDKVMKELEKKYIPKNEQERKNLSWWEYYGCHEIRRERREKYKKEMEAEGWTEISDDIIKEAKESGKKLRIKGSVGGVTALFTQRVDKVYRPVYYMSEDRCMIGVMAPRCSTKYINIHNFEGCFCKIVK